MREGQRQATVSAVGAHHWGPHRHRIRRGHVDNRTPISLQGLWEAQLNKGHSIWITPHRLWEILKFSTEHVCWGPCSWRLTNTEGSWSSTLPHTEEGWFQDPATEPADALPPYRLDYKGCSHFRRPQLCCDCQLQIFPISWCFCYKDRETPKIRIRYHWIYTSHHTQDLLMYTASFQVYVYKHTCT